MISNAKEWAKSRGLYRKNPVHQEEEYKIPTDFNFSYTSSKTREAEGSGEFEVEDPDGTLLNFGDMSAEAAMMCLGSNKGIGVDKEDPYFHIIIKGYLFTTAP